ncbi:sigma-70 family RNA polymerase sigma factor [uncultured Ruminococcus sp.]|uniref:sigma-70 family RNA polymerase sigma factor n=2 Tax=uncultured Ruminococcus sp. TaxID=165186 RepID=UPI002604618C|nr:sigma-70 family RNA polymerase sigma factor [uncultured Ruminococcus sp.]
MTKDVWDSLLFSMDSQVERREKKRVACHIAKNIIENELSARQKQILVLYYKEKKTMPEIAHALGVNVSTVSRTHRRACDSIRSRLRAYDLF